jgi:lipopolysaccharide biosynthesis protein
MWDNSSRRKTNATIFRNFTPEAYGEWLEAVIKNFRPYSENENFIFINAWNEWAEGNHLEPCQKWGTRYLEKTKKVLQNA